MAVSFNRPNQGYIVPPILVFGIASFAIRSHQSPVAVEIWQTHNVCRRPTMPQRDLLTCGTWPCVEWPFGIPQLRRYSYHCARRSFVDHTGEIITSWVHFWPEEANRVVNSKLMLLKHQKRIARRAPAIYKSGCRVKQGATLNLPVFLDSSSPGFVIRWRHGAVGGGSLGTILVTSKVRLRNSLRMVRFGG